MTTLLAAPKVLTADSWPPKYVSVYAWRQAQAYRILNDPKLMYGALEYYREHPVEFICHWCDTYDPRNSFTDDLPARLPFVLFQRQAEMAEFLIACLTDQSNGLVDKSRDMGATWIAVGVSVWLWRFREGAAIGWGSRKEELVDRLGDPKSIFEKIRQLIRGLPKFFLPRGFDMDTHATFMKVVNPENGASIVGEAGDNIGRGGRTLIYFKDESAHYMHAESIEAALGDNTNVQIDISTPNGIGTIYDRKREAAREWSPGSVIDKSFTRAFVMDWSHHPAKTMEWYRDREAKAKREGLVHIFRQEVDRNAAASLQGVIIPADWVSAAIDAHAKLGFDDAGQWLGALDVADEGGDLNGLTFRKGVIVKYAEDWSGDGEGPGASGRKAFTLAVERGCYNLQYDCIGVGSSVKSEAARLKSDYREGRPGLPPHFQAIAWDAGAGVVKPKERLVSGDKTSPINEDFYKNLKAQGWWNLRRRFEKTYQMITDPGLYKYRPDELISLPSSLSRLSQLKRELSQPTIKYDGQMRIMVDKKPDGAKSPNLGDSIMMLFFPLQGQIVISDEALRLADQVSR